MPASWKDAQDAPKASKHTGPAKLVDLVNNVLDPVDRMDGDSLPVSAFTPHATIRPFALTEEAKKRYDKLTRLQTIFGEV